MGPRALAVILLLVPSLALPQTAGVLTTVPVEVGRAGGPASSSCGTASVTLRWTSATAAASGNTWRVAVQADTDACPTTTNSAPVSTASNVVVANQLVVSGTTTASSALSPGVIETAGSVTCVTSGSAADVVKNLCVWLVVSPGAGETSTPVAAGTFSFQFARPPPPILNGVRPANSALIVDFSRGADSGLDNAVPDQYRVYVYGATADPICIVTPPATVPVDPACLIMSPYVPSSGSRVTGLSNNTQYTLQLTAVSSGGNESDPSNTQYGTPLPFVSFWDNYQAAGGREQGGCGGGAGALSLLALLPLTLRRRRP